MSVFLNLFQLVQRPLLTLIQAIKNILKGKHKFFRTMHFLY